MIEEEVRSKLFEMQDLSYRDFHSKLMPTIDKENIIGVRIPALRKFSKEFAKTDGAEQFLKILPHKFYEENNVHAFLIETIKDYDEVIARLDDFLPYVDNWATCDLMSPRILKKHPEELFEKIKQWIKSDNVYTARFAIGMLMKYYLDEKFKIEYLNMVSCIKSDEYYINMMIAWYFATALAKQYEETLPYIENRVLDDWVHKKTIQKAIESNRIDTDQKAYLRTLK